VTPQIETAEVTKDYDGLCALDHVSIAAQLGQTTSIVGVNGAGKTTLLKILAGLDFPTSGMVLLQGQEANSDQLRTHCTLVFQRNMMFGSSVYDNVAYGLKIKQSSSVDVPEKVRSALALVNLQGFDRRNARKLSSGEQRRVSIARALAVDRDVLLLDEPTANLDPANTIIIERAIKECAQSRAVVLSTHDLLQARRLSDRMIHLYRGRVVEEAEPHRFFAKPQHEATRLFMNGELYF